MKRLFDQVFGVASIAYLACLASPAIAQELWKYTDKNGKVTYSDKAPKDGEKAERVIADTTGTVIPGASNMREGKTQSSASISGRAAEREALREQLRKTLVAAREELEAAKKALADGREPTEDERQIVVGRDKNGRPTGANAMVRKPAYDERIAGLEADIKKAEEKVAAAEKNARDNSPR